MLNDLYRFESKYKRCNKYESINNLCKKSRRLANKNSGHVLDSKFLGYVLRDENPPKYSDNIVWEDKFSILDSISDPDVVRSVKSSVQVSTKDNIQYVYLDCLSRGQRSRVRTLVNMIMLS